MDMEELIKLSTSEEFKKLSFKERYKLIWSKHSTFKKIVLVFGAIAILAAPIIWIYDNFIQPVHHSKLKRSTPITSNNYTSAQSDSSSFELNDDSCEMASKKIKMGTAEIFCITPYYGNDTSSAEKFKQLMYNNQLTGISASYIQSSDRCELTISASGQIYGTSFSDTITCQLEPDSVKYIINRSQ